MAESGTKSSLHFASKPKAKDTAMKPWKILIADDEPDVHHVTKLVLEGRIVFDRGIELISAFSAKETKEILSNTSDIACILLDVVMEKDDSGLEVVRFIREELANKSIRIILRTGQPGQAPESKVILEYEINDYKQKTDLTVEKLFSAVVTAIRSYRDIRTIEQSRKGMEMIISASSYMLKTKSIMLFAAGVLNQIISLLYISHDAFYLRSRADEASGFTAKEDGEDMKVLAGAGKYAGLEDSSFPDGLMDSQIALVHKAIETETNIYDDGTFVIVLKGREGVHGILYLEDCPPLPEIDLRLIAIFCNNVSEAFSNILLYEELEEKVKERTRELQKANDELKAAQAQMLQQEKMASIGQLAAGIAHEINNPMSYIISNLATLDGYIRKLSEFIERIPSGTGDACLEADLLMTIASQKKELDIGFIGSDIRSLAAESLSGAHRVQKIVNDLRIFSSVDTPGSATANVNECIEATIEVLGEQLRSKADVVKDLTDPLSAKCAADRLNLVFLNILLNAAQAIGTHGTIYVKTHMEGAESVISIRDTGVGIPPDRLSRIFEPFYTTKDVGMGIGLGLTIAYDIVRSCGGIIAVQSEVGIGTCFTITLPT
jgi:signal transduction histidine kinase/DNA-binding response OmpR family regulator